MMNTKERIQYEKEIGIDAGKDYDVLRRTNVNWLDQVFNDSAPLQNYELSVNGATEKQTISYPEVSLIRTVSPQAQLFAGITCVPM